MIIVHKVRLSPNNDQASYFAQACGIARFAYNWGLAEWKRLYEAGEKPSESQLRKQLNSLKKTEFPWMLDVTKVAPQQALKNLGTAFQRFFKGQGKYPKFKKKGINDSFRADNGPAKAGVDAVPVECNYIKLPKIGWIKMRESLRFDGQVKSVTISRKADQWYAAISIDTHELPHERKNHGSVGVDLGIKALATLSTGETEEGPKALRVLLPRLCRLSRQLSRKKKGSANHGKAKKKLARLHKRISDVRQDATHKLTTKLVLENTKIGIEDLNVKGMMKNGKLAKHIADASFYEFRRQIEYKARWYGSTVVVAGRWFPSSKTCSSCGSIRESLKLSERFWVCSCGATLDRDINAAINLEKLAASSAVSVCGEEGSGATLVA